MSQKAKKSKMKDLDPKDRAKNVKGGIFCLVGAVARLPGRAVTEGKARVREALNPR